MNKVLLSGKRLVKRFSGRAEPVLGGIDVEILEGDFTVVMGSSGAGKSTLLYTLSGMDRLSGGQVFYKGKEITRLREKQMARLRADEFGFVFQQTHLVGNLTLLENVAVAGYLHPKQAGTQKRAHDLLRRMGVAEAENRLPSEVSGGEAQRAAIARAMIGRPGLLFADEPTGALGRRSTDEVLDLLTALNREGQSLLMVTHELRASARGNRLLYLEDGKVLDELRLPAYAPDQAKQREAQISEWLTALNW